MDKTFNYTEDDIMDALFSYFYIEDEADEVSLTANEDGTYTLLLRGENLEESN